MKCMLSVNTGSRESRLEQVEKPQPETSWASVHIDGNRQPGAGAAGSGPHNLISPHPNSLNRAKGYQGHPGTKGNGAMSSLGGAEGTVSCRDCHSLPQSLSPLHSPHWCPRPCCPLRDWSAGPRGAEGCATDAACPQPNPCLGAKAAGWGDGTFGKDYYLSQD